MYRENVTKEGDVIHKHYNVSVFDGKFFEHLTNFSKSIDSAHIVIVLIVSGLAAILGSTYVSAKYPDPVTPQSPLMRCIKAPGSDDSCLKAYQAETDRIKVLSDEVVRRELEEAKKVHVENKLCGMS